MRISRSGSGSERPTLSLTLTRGTLYSGGGPQTAPCRLRPGVSGRTGRRAIIMVELAIRIIHTNKECDVDTIHAQSRLSRWPRPWSSSTPHARPSAGAFTPAIATAQNAAPCRAQERPHTPDSDRDTDTPCTSHSDRDLTGTQPGSHSRANNTLYIRLYRLYAAIHSRAHGRACGRGTRTVAPGFSGVHPAVPPRHL